MEQAFYFVVIEITIFTESIFYANGSKKSSERLGYV